MNLNGWQRLGVVASVLWLVIGALYGNNAGLAQGDVCLMLLDTCSVDAETCIRHFQTSYDAATANHWLYARGYAVVPVILGWLFAWALVAVVRWVRAGFSKAALPIESERSSFRPLGNKYPESSFG
jgi:hypothetical protein